ncbi:MAG: phage holin family protein [Gemmatimonas sp.]
MFQRMIDDLKESVSSRLQQVVLTAVLAVALLIAVAFLFAAAFVFVAHAYGAIIACLAAAGLFFIVAIIVGIWHAARKRDIEARARERARARARNLLTDPAIVTTGLQVVRAVGAKRLIPLLAVAGVALGVLMSRSAAQDQATPAE